MEIIGTSNKFLEIDVKTKISKIFDIDETLVKKYLGGKGLGLKILYDRMNLQCDPLGDENMLVFSLGVMLGTERRVPPAGRAYQSRRSRVLCATRRAAVRLGWL